MRWKACEFRLILLVGVVALLATSCGAPRARGPLLSAPPSAAADNDIYVADAMGRIRALRPDGTEQWSHSLADDVARVDNGASHDLRIDYLAARSGGKLFGLATLMSGNRAGQTILFALDGNRLLWQREIPATGQGIVPIAIGHDALYEAGDDGKLYAFARDDGHTLWQYHVSEGSLGSPTVGTDGTIYITGPRLNLHAIAPDGSQRWVVETQK